MKIMLILPFNVYGGEYDHEQILEGGAEAELPLGICYLKSYLLSHHKNIEVFTYDSHIDALDHIVNQDNKADMNVLWNNVNNKIVQYDPDLIGVSAFSHAMASESHKIIDLAKKHNKKVITVMGGSYPTIDSDIAMEDPNLDFIVRSEGEIVFNNLITALVNKSDYTNIKGLVFRQYADIESLNVKQLNYIIKEESGKAPGKASKQELKGIAKSLTKNKIIKNEGEKRIQDLDMLPYPDFSDLPINLYNELTKTLFERISKDPRHISMVTARGCVFHCSFCATKQVWGNAHNRKPEEVIKELKYYKEKYNINTVKFNDDYTMKDRKRVKKICDLLIEEKVIRNWYTVGLAVHSLQDPELVDKMVRSGYKYFLLSCESGCEKTQRKIHKPVTNKMIRKVVNNLRQYDDVYVMGGFIVGFPFETKDNIKETFDFAQSLELNWAAFNLFTPFPATELYDYCVKEGYLPYKKFTYLDCQNTNPLKTPNFESDWVSFEKYKNNLEINFLSNFYLKRKDYAEAIRQFKLILKMDPNHAFALMLNAYCYSKLNDNNNADQCRNRAIYLFKNDDKWFKYFDSLKSHIKEKGYIDVDQIIQTSSYNFFGHINTENKSLIKQGYPMP